jgi:hypothetical protein
MSDAYLFQNKKTGYQMQVFAVSLKDAKEFIGYSGEAKYIGKNIQTSKYTCAATTEKQMQKNRENLARIMNGI